MGRDLQKRKRRSSRPATRQPSSTRKKLTNPLGNAIIAQNWNKKETTTQNYRRLGLVSRLRAPTGGVEPGTRPGTTTTASKRKVGGDPFAIPGAQSSAAAGEVRVERDETGKITRVIDPSSQNKKKRANPLNDPLVDIETDSDASSSAADAEEWGGFEGEENEIVRQLEDEANRPVEKKPRTASSRETEWLQSLVDRHGDDFSAMARDGKLNPYQQTAADIKRRVRKWKGDKQ
ncbi:ribosome biogenesis protein Nop16 [Nemania sp. FL0916]|nr:ribosome biogenesis protein Nop16 [Nemania sp. FL0916]